MGIAIAVSGMGYATGATPARAAVVSYDADLGRLSFTAPPGETNVVTVEYRPWEATITDSGPPLVARTGCHQIDVFTAVCGSGEDWFDLGDEADSIRVVGPPRYVELRVFTGAGDDTVRAGAFSAIRTGFIVVRTGGGNDTVIDGPSDSDLDGGGGDDTVRGGPGSDYIAGGAGDDALHGGRGRDILVYEQAPRGVSVNLVTGLARGWGRDRLRGFQSVSGSDFADVLIGDRGPNFLQGWGGNDRIHGRRGLDWLDGGSGDDALFARDGRWDSVRGGRGSDRACVDRRVDRVFSIGRFSCQL